jgi:hypothetical protein
MDVSYQNSHPTSVIPASDQTGAHTGTGDIFSTVVLPRCRKPEVLRHDPDLILYYSIFSRHEF